MAQLLPAQLQNFSLNGSGVSIADTTMTLSSFQTIDGTNLAMSDFGTIGYMTIEPGSRDREEQISFSGVTQNANGTATLTGIKTVLFLSPYTESSGFAKSHPGGVIAVVTNTSGFYNKFGIKTNAEVLTNYWEGLDPITAQGLVTRDYMLALINGGTVSIAGLVETATAGETITAGNLVYFSESDNEWMKTDADTLATVMNVKLGIAQGAGTNGNPITGGVLTRGSYTTSGLTAGDIMYAGNTAGAISSTVGTVPRVIGIANTTTSLYFDPDFQNRLYDYAADSVGTDSYAITLPGALSVPFTGMIVSFKAGTANTGACTLAINGGSAVSIKKNVSDDLTTGDILASQVVRVIYDGTNYQIISKTPLVSPIRRVYTSNDTWTKPAGLKYVEVQVQGAGGGGGGTSTNNVSAAGGGGGGYSWERLAAASVESTSVTVGVAGTAGAAAEGTGGTGGTSMFGTLPYLQATGGSGGGAASSGGGAGGVGSGGDLNLVGGGGGGSSSVANTSSGIGGSSHLGGGGNSRASGGNNTGVAGGNYGGGGSGGASAGGAGAGGAGAGGAVIIDEYYA